MDPHSPYLPPAPYERMFYHGNECDPNNKSMEPVMSFKPFCDYFASWMPAGITDKDYVIAQYDGAIAYMDACIQTLFNALETHGIMDETIVVSSMATTVKHCMIMNVGLITTDFMMLRSMYHSSSDIPDESPQENASLGYNQHKDLVPTLLELADIETDIAFDGDSLTPLISGEIASYDSEFYITECTWMRKHGWRTPEWKLIVALEPDFHYKPPVELYNLIADPDENENLADKQPDIVNCIGNSNEELDPPT